MYNKKSLHALNAECVVKCIMFDCTEANPGEMLNVSLPKLNGNGVLVPGMLVPCFDIDLSGGHANNFLVQKVMHAHVDKLVVKFGGTTLQDTVGYDICKTFEGLFLPGEKRDNMVPEGIQSKDLYKIHSNAGNKKTLWCLGTVMWLKDTDILQNELKNDNIITERCLPWWVALP